MRIGGGGGIIIVMVVVDRREQSLVVVHVVRRHGVLVLALDGFVEMHHRGESHGHW